MSGYLHVESVDPVPGAVGFAAAAPVEVPELKVVEFEVADNSEIAAQTAGPAAAKVVELIVAYRKAQEGE